MNPWGAVLLGAFGFSLGFIFTSFAHQPWFTTSSNFTRTLKNETREYEVSVSPKVFEGNGSLFSTVRVLCWVVTNPKNHKTKAEMVKKTWGKRCNILLFMSSVEDPLLPSIALPVSEGRHNLWAKTKEALKYIYHHHQNDADWFFKADDDTYAIMENMRYFLHGLNRNEPLFVGCQFKPFTAHGFMSGGAGYVFTRKTLEIFAANILGNGTKCREDSGGYEDVETAKCLSNSGVKFIDTRDSSKALLFMPYLPDVFAFPQRISQSDTKWFLDYTRQKVPQGFDCCGEYAATFHYVPPEVMQLLEYLIYRLNYYGTSYITKDDYKS